jgi:hypothetical protein
MKKMYVQVTEQDLQNIDINELVKQGVIYRLTQNTPPRNLDTILTYVGRIEECVTPAFRNCIVQLWKDILCSETIKPKIFITKGKNKGNPNLYLVIAILEILLQNNVYDNKKYSLMALWRIMKNSNDNIHFYTSSQVYFTHELVIIIREIMITYLQKLTENIK